MNYAIRRFTNPSHPTALQLMELELVDATIADEPSAASVISAAAPLGLEQRNHVLMKGSVVSAGARDAEAAQRAKTARL